MEIRDYVLFALGAMILAFSYVYTFDDIAIGGWVRGFGWGFVIALTLKAVWKLIVGGKKRFRVL